MKHTLQSDLDAVSQADVDMLHDSLALFTEQSKEFLRYALANARLFDRKQLDYGPKNISAFGSFGCIVRMGDKLGRLSNLFMNRKRKVVNESITDSLRDISNYSVIALLWEDGKWQK